jgi:hypothetical protein
MKQVFRRKAARWNSGLLHLESHYHPAAVKTLKESWEEVAEGEMPPSLYLSIHRDATLSAEDRTALRTWALGTSSGPEGMGNE